MRYIKAPLLTFLLLILLTRCSRKDNSDYNAIKNENRKVYITGGRFRVEATDTIRYWINDNAIFPNGTTKGWTSDIVVQGDDVYISGTGKEPDGTYTARYWKNDEVIVLEKRDSSISVGTGIAVDGDDVYVVGYEATDHSNHSVAKIWKNGKASVLVADSSRYDERGYYAQAHAVAVYNSDVYVVGTEQAWPILWKNGIATKLGTESGNALNITIANGDVYVSGSQGHKAVYWKNGTTVILEGTDKYGEATGIAVVGNDVHVSGSGQFLNKRINRIRSMAMYWKNDKVFALTDTVEAQATDVVVVDDDVYVCGYEGLHYSSWCAVKYWKNGEPFVISKFPSTYPLGWLVDEFSHGMVVME